MLENPPIVHITNRHGATTLLDYQRPCAGPIREKAIVRCVEEFDTTDEWPRGVYIFTRLDAMPPEQLALSQALWERLQQHPDKCVTLTEPRKAMGRYRLLRTLHELGRNDFNVHMPDEIDGVRYPAFLRYEKRHDKNLTEPLDSRAEMEDAIAAELAKGTKPDELVITEWLDYADERGHYAKYGAHVVGDRVLPKHVMVGTQWMIKMKQSKRLLVWNREIRYIRENPHEDAVREIVAISGHQWGRIDYSFYKGRMQVWEFNDNPLLGTKWKYDIGRGKAHGIFFSRLVKAVDDLGAHLEPGPPMRFALEPEPKATDVERLAN